MLRLVSQEDSFGVASDVVLAELALRLRCSRFVPGRSDIAPVGIDRQRRCRVWIFLRSRTLGLVTI